MQVLRAPSSPIPPPSPPFAGDIPPKPSHTLLDRRLTTKRLLNVEQNATIPLTHSMGLLAAAPSLTVSQATALGMTNSPSSTALRSSRPTSHGQTNRLPFVPLTPIMASPRLTPDIGTAAGSVVMSNVPTGAGAHPGGEGGSGASGGAAADSNPVDNHKAQGSNPDGPVSVIPFLNAADYLNRGRPASAHTCSQNDTNVAGPSFITPAQSSLPPPSWTSTPPTPPLKASAPVPLSRLGMGMNSDALRKFSPVSPSDFTPNSGSPRRSRTRSGSRSRHARPASVSVFPAYRPPSPPTLSLHIGQHDTTQQKCDLPDPSSSSCPAFSPTARPPPHALSASSDCASPDSYVPLSSPASITSVSYQPPRNSSQLDLHFSTAALASSSSAVSAPGGGAVRRRRSLPRQLLSSAPAIGCKKEYSRSAETVFMSHKYGRSLDSNTERGPDGVLLPSLSRTGRSHSIRPKNAGPSLLSVARQESTSSSRKRKMFIVGDGDASDGESENWRPHRAHLQVADSVETNPQPDIVTGEPAIQSDEKEDRKRTRRYHALLELVTTEVGYLLDLRALVSIYLTQLPSLDAPAPSFLSRPSPSALSIPSLGLPRPFPSSRSSFLHCPPGPIIVDASLAPAERPREAFEREREPDREKERDKPSRRPLFSEQEAQVVIRNTSELLALHEKFVKSLEKALEPFGFGSAFAQASLDDKKRVAKDAREDKAVHNVDEAVTIVADLFAREVSSFDVYEAFCPGHNEATDLIRSVQEHHPLEWDAYEQRCSLRVAHVFERVGPSSSSMDSIRGRDSLRSKRRHSMSSLAMPMALSPLGTAIPIPTPLSTVGHSKSDPSSGHKRQASGDIPSSGGGQAGRLKFLDYLIKPVQRICKYPMLLDQLKAKKTPSSDEAGLPTNDGIEAAASAMRGVVAMVDRASERRAHYVKSNLIASRLTSNCPVSPISPITPEDRPAQLSPEFMHSLGACLLAGALDVVYYQSNGSARAKYLAAFLYVGGYLILAKVPKGGKAYEPKHWFSLSGFEFMEQEDDEALPYAFYLCSPTVQIHFAAACQSEKMIWTAAIQEALLVDSPAWMNEPAASLPVNALPVVFASEDIAVEWATPLPTIQSMSELETSADINAPAPPFPSPRKIPKTISRVDGIILRQELPMSSLNRRTSTSSVKAFFSPLTFDFRVTRPSAQIRHQVDNGLHDVVTDSFITVRSQAQMRDEELFQLRKRPGNVSRSNSGLSISGAFSSRKRQDSIILSSRRKGSVDGMVDITNDLDAATGKGVNLVLTRRPKSSGGKLRSKHRLSVLPAPTSIQTSRVEPDVDAPLLESPEGCVESPSPMTQCSSSSSSNANSVLPSPLEMTMPLPPPSSFFNRYPDTRGADGRPKRTRSMVDNVKYFFQSRSTSPTPSFQRSPSITVSHLDAEPDTHGGLIHWWRRGSLRRRAQSSPEAPTDESTPVTPAASSDDSSHADFNTSSDGHMLLPTLSGTASRKPSFSGGGTPTLLRRRSLFASATRPDLHSPLAVEPVPSLSRSKTLKNILLFQRSSSTSEDVR